MFSVLVNIDNICHWCRKVSQEKQESRRKHLLLKARNTINFFFLPFSQQETWAKYCFRLHNLPFQITRIIWRFHHRHLWGRDLTRKVMFFLFYKTVHIKPVTHFALNGRLFVCTQDTQKEPSPGEKHLLHVEAKYSRYFKNKTAQKRELFD